MNSKTLTRAVILVPLFLALTVGLLVGCSEEQPSKMPVSAAESNPPDEAATASGERKIKYWASPMDPTFISDKPGKSPMGMDLVPV